MKSSVSSLGEQALVNLQTNKLSQIPAVLRERCLQTPVCRFCRRMLVRTHRALTLVQVSRCLHPGSLQPFPAQAASSPGRIVTVLAQPRVTEMLLEDKKQLVANSIRGVPDFPKKGILFWDITTLCLDPKAFKCCIDAFEARYTDQKIDVIAGVIPHNNQQTVQSWLQFHCIVSRLPAGFEARGFIFGPPLAMALDCAFVPLRKPGKLPGNLQLRHINVLCTYRMWNRTPWSNSMHRL